MSEPSDLEARRQAEAVEYGQFVATQAIYMDGVLAYNAGDPVPASNVAVHGYDQAGLVRRTDQAPVSPASSPAIPAGPVNTEEKD